MRCKTGGTDEIEAACDKRVEVVRMRKERKCMLLIEHGECGFVAMSGDTKVCDASKGRRVGL